MNHLSLLHLPRLAPAGRRHGRTTAGARLPRPEPIIPRSNQQRRLSVTVPPPPPPPSSSSNKKQTLEEEPTEVEEEEGAGGGGAGGRTCELPTWGLVGGIAAGVAVALALSAVGAGPAAAMGPEGPLVEEFWDNMRRYALYAVTVSTGFAYTLLEPIVELLKNPITALLIVAFIAGSGLLVSQVLNAMAGNSDFIYSYEQ
ncbi:hypothetical protein GUJ93_ZPchr0013g37130 [Zizania palustris]|uniref:Uncharacterized protein ycf33 n=1 Tax=Zizania palustris TaxID=103762 RepID=A0A8J6BYT6_ZIZPA|nr:hypothetical protein GUJ93_ZPchr0013g37130 [Zizania palustris]